MLVTSLSLMAEFIGSNSSSLAFVYGTMSFFWTNYQLDVEFFEMLNRKKTPNPVKNLSKKLIVP